jgi:hypothetical protein
MESGQKNTSKNNNASKQETSVPATEIARNPNPRANENIKDKAEQENTSRSGTDDTVGSEITDGEDA